MKNEVVSKTLSLVSIFLFISVIITPIITGSNFVDDTTPPITTHTLDPPTPDGDNGWYVSDVNVTLNATDDMSGVKEIKYKVWGGVTRTIIGDNGSFIVDDEDEDISVEYWGIDNAGNEESHNKFYIAMDQTGPVIDVCYDFIVIENDSWMMRFNATATDYVSKINRVEFYSNYELRETIYGPGPTYIWDTIILGGIDYRVKGFIRNKEITDEFVKFFAVILKIYPYFTLDDCFFFRDIKAYAYDNAGNYRIDWPYIYDPNLPSSTEYFKKCTFSNEYIGHIGNYYINAVFDREPINITPGNINFQFNKLNNRLSTGSLFLRFLDNFPLLHRLLDIWRLNLL